MDFIAASKPRLSYSFWAAPGHEGQTLQDLEKAVREAGNEVIEVDEENQRLLIGRWEAGDDLWGCIICHANGFTVLLDSQGELERHADADHPGWRDHADSP